MSKDFEATLKEYSPILSRVASSYEADLHLRQELLQEISLAVWQALVRFKGDSSIKTYILRIAHNRAVNHVAYRVKQLNSESYCEMTAPLPSSKQSGEQSTIQDRQIEALLNGVRQLSIQNRQVMTMSMEGLSYQEIATVCGISVTNVGAILSRAKKELAEKVQNVG